MPAPRPAILVLLLILVAVLVFFVVGIGLGTQQRRGTSLGEISSLKERVRSFAKAPGVSWPPGPRCPEISRGGACPLEVPRGKGLLRKVSVTTTQPMVIDFAPASTPDRTVTLDMTEDQSKPAELYVDYKGGRLILKCAAPLGSICRPIVN